MTARSVDDLLRQIDGLLDRHNRLARIDRQIATERDSTRRAALRMLRRDLKEEGEL